MIVDTSAIMAILQEEPERPAYVAVLAEADQAFLSAGNWIELGAVLKRPGDEGPRRALDSLIEQLHITIAPVTVVQARIGHAAYLRYGKGNHPAKLNLGDCFAYALAKETGLPLLFKGADFTQTDIAPAI